ncbi:MAG TPA: ATP-dependent Clp protease adapter ClpS [Pseudogulbenkiania sp.]|jgi:ATP-dependent Clp protease adaptor protein ClpS|nr:ATP-dependent Clp protease adapter ClpS [Pseudogulbenkiania sp.]
MSTQYKDDAQLEASRAKTRPPSMYKVLLLNDDYTPMDFVVEILQHFFHKNREQATHIMLQVHTQGRGVCGVYTKDVAATKVEQVLQFAKAHQHPLQCVMEEN